MNKNFKLYLIIFGLFILIDIPMIILINGSMYQNLFDKINNGPMISNIYTLIIAIIIYLILALGIYYFILNPNINDIDINYKDIFMKGCVLGFVIYSVYDLTNLLSINKFTIKEALIDILWGTSLSGVISVLSIYLFNKIKF